tara:strand:+ start:1782 stop:3512 length:1731 start_codon:yes stop_codon:yes gene_type:complete
MSIYKLSTLNIIFIFFIILFDLISGSLIAEEKNDYSKQTYNNSKISDFANKNTFKIKNRSYLNINGPNISLNFKNSPAEEILQLFANIGQFNFVLINDNSNNSVPFGATKSKKSKNLITVSFNDENYTRAINSVLMAANLQAKLIENTLYVGDNVLLKTFSPKVSKIYKLRQSSASSAADFLASLGASISKVATTSITSEDIDISGSSGSVPQPSDLIQKTSNVTSIETYGSAIGPLVGLSGTTDSRLQTIFLMGEPELINLAEKYLNEIDKRQKQVALSLKILDINLTGSKTFENSFSWSMPNAFILNNAGAASANIGPFKPPSTVKGGAPSKFTGGEEDALNIRTVARAELENKSNYPSNQILNFISAKIESTDTRIIASPTLILSENSEDMGSGNGGSIGRSKANEAFVNVGNNVVTAYKITKDDNGAVYCEPKFETAGLSLGARVQKIDADNYVSFVLEPSVSAAIGSTNQGGCGTINTINQRKLQSGSVRVKDGDTLILTGVISDKDTEVISKWPILGDIPILGNLFKNSGKSKEKRELVILVTPRIIGEDFKADSYNFLNNIENLKNLNE